MINQSATGLPLACHWHDQDECFQEGSGADGVSNDAPWRTAVEHRPAQKRQSPARTSRSAPAKTRRTPLLRAQASLSDKAVAVCDNECDMSPHLVPPYLILVRIPSSNTVSYDIVLKVSSHHAFSHSILRLIVWSPHTLWRSVQ